MPTDYNIRINTMLALFKQFVGKLNRHERSKLSARKYLTERRAAEDTCNLKWTCQFTQHHKWATQYFMEPSLTVIQVI